MIDRFIYTSIHKNLFQQKVSIIIGARRVGKTALLKKIQQEAASKVLWLNGEDLNVQQLLENRSVSNYQRLLGDIGLLIIDEVQFVPDFGRKIKLMIDTVEPLHILLSSSSAFKLQQGSEPLIGRTITYRLYPIWQGELNATENLLDTISYLEDRLIYGSYPEVLNKETAAEKRVYLNELTSIFLLTDITAFETLRQPQKIRDLLKLLAWQIGKDVALEELGKSLALSRQTVERYLELLEQSFIIYRQRAFNRNLRKEIAKSSRWNFYDNGIRNAIISNFSPLAVRQDVGMLWENYVLSERLKKINYQQLGKNTFFWRTYDGQEIDWIEEGDGTITATECKWKQENAKAPAAFSSAYPEASFQVINQQSYLNWIA